MAEKFKVVYRDDDVPASQEFSIKGLAFAFAKKTAPKVDGEIAVTRLVSVPEGAVKPTRWRAVKRWNFYPDGLVEIGALN